MQTDVYLQKALVNEVKDVLKGYTTINNGEAVDFNVYPQNLPAKTGRNDENHFPYVLVCLDEEVIQDEDSNNICTVYFVVGINDKNPNGQGHFDVANVMNLISERLLKKRLIANRFRLQLPLSKKFQEDDTWPKFFGGITTLWEVNKPMQEETQYD